MHLRMRAYFIELSLTLLHVRCPCVRLFVVAMQQLKAQKSAIAVTKEPRCFVDTGICSVTWSQDKVRQYVAYLPTVAVISLVWVIFAFELTPLRYVNPLIDIILGSPVIWVSNGVICSLLAHLQISVDKLCVIFSLFIALRFKTVTWHGYKQT